MQGLPKNILCTRQIDPKWIARAQRHNIHITTKDFIAIQPVINDGIAAAVDALAKVKDAIVVFTSKNAVDILAGDYLRNISVQWRIYCMEGSTKQAVEKYFPAGSIAGTAIYSHELADVILQQTVEEPIHFFCGDLRREELPQKLKQSGRVLTEYLIYRTILTAGRIREKYDGILFFSPSAANSFFSDNRLPDNAVCFAIGETTAAAVRSKTGNKVIISKYMNTEKMIETVAEYFGGCE